MGASHFLAFDLGAESGRAMAARLSGRPGSRRLELRELKRFPNRMVAVAGHLHWDFPRLLEQVKEGIAACVAEGYQPASLGVDTWGVDFGLLDSNGRLLGLPYAYRDTRTEGMMEAFFTRVPRERIYQLTGVQFLRFNTLYQLFAMVQEGSPWLAEAAALLFMPDLFNHALTGEKKTEFTYATTSQLYNPLSRGWEEELFQALGLPVALMQQLVAPGTRLGELTEEVVAETGARGVTVVATASHDTAAAVAAVPAEPAAPGEGDWAYISSGTWSLMGVESAQPIITEESLALNFTNEGGVGGTFRVLKNVVGLWLVQECRRAWEAERSYTYEELTALAAEAPAFRAVIVPDYPGFLNPPSMPAAIAAFCEHTSQPTPRGPGEYVRCALEGLALKYRMTLEELRRLWQRPIRRLHVIGGGARNELLCQFTADACAVPVVAGPAEATAAGNALVQAMAMGEVGCLVELREIVRRSFPLKEYWPKRPEDWEEPYQRFQELHRWCMAK